MTEAPPTIHVVDDDASFRDACGELLKAAGYRVSLHESAGHLLKILAGAGPGCILLDVQMAGLKGPQLQDHLRELGCKLPIVFISGHQDTPTTVRTIKAGAEDFLTKPVEKERLFAAIERALAHYEEIRVSDEQLETLRSQVSRLTPRETEVFQLLVRGKLHKQIAFTLGVSERTVKSHRHGIIEKLHVRSLADLAVIAECLGLLAEAGQSVPPPPRPAGRVRPKAP